MAFRPPKKQPRFADLNGILAQSNKSDNALYQTIQIMIERLTQFQAVTLEEIADVNNSVSNSVTIINTTTADKKATYVTTTNETLNLPNSSIVLAGAGISFDTSVPNQLTIESTGSVSDHYDSPLSDGDLTAAELIFADGECIIVQVPI